MATSATGRVVTQEGKEMCPRAWLCWQVPRRLCPPGDWALLHHCGLQGSERLGLGLLWVSVPSPAWRDRSQRAGGSRPSPLDQKQ